MEAITRMAICIPPHHGQQAGHDQGGKGADHVDFTMGEVDQLNDAVDHGVAQGDQGVYAAPGQPAQKQLEKIFKIHIQGGITLRF
jgi:hypothetical protein